MTEACAVPVQQPSWLIIAVLSCVYCRAVWLDAFHSYVPPEQWSPDKYQCWRCTLLWRDSWYTDLFRKVGALQP